MVEFTQRIISLSVIYGETPKEQVIVKKIFQKNISELEVLLAWFGVGWKVCI